MSKLTQVLVPDIGSFAQVGVIDVHVKPGDSINVDDNLITLESDKAAMDIPSPYKGVVKEVKIKTGDKVGKDSLILTMAVEDLPANEEASAKETPKAETKKTAPEKSAPTLMTINVPDIGSAKQVAVIEVNVAVGDKIDVDSAVVTLESEKASMEVPSPVAGIVKRVLTKVGAQVNEGMPLVEVEAQAMPKASQTPAASKAAPQKTTSAAPARSSTANIDTSSLLTSPAVRRLARELDINLLQVRASGEKGRITKEDIKRFLTGQGSGLPAMPEVDFTQWGEVTVKPLSRIQKISASVLHRNWVNIPHVTQFDSVDITNMESYRQQNKAKAEKAGTKLTPLVFIMKAVVEALKEYPTFNSSLAADGENIVLKNYFHIGVAVDTPNGLVVPVIRDVDKKDVFTLAKELAEMSKLAREGKLTGAQMQGSCFSISSLGGIGGTAFTPIINAPDVAILGVSKSQMQPVYMNNKFEPRLMLPLSLSYDHRVIDGAVAARFIVALGKFLQEIK